MDKQKKGFVSGEADAWFHRNRDHLRADSPLRDLTTGALAAHVSAGARVLEIGCGQGDNLAALAARIPIEGHGIDPSQAAVAAGQAAYPALHLVCATADALPYPDHHFDGVWFGFCLYLVDRELLARCVAEADRVLKDGGTLCIVDFDPGEPCRRPYHHAPGLWSYKMDYSALFLANPAYRLAAKLAASHTGLAWSPEPQERIGVWICKKSLATAYRDAT